jgi:hypothetical protein
MFPDNIVVSPSGVGKSKFCLTFFGLVYIVSKSRTKYQMTLRHIPEKGKHHQHRRGNPKIGEVDFALLDWN